MFTSDKPESVCVTIEPPPPEPPIDLNKPPGTILYDVGVVNTPSFLIIIAPK